MKNVLLPAFLLLVLVACHRDAPEAIEPEYADWYAIKAPQAESIQAVYGDIDESLLIATRFKVYQTTDRGKTWRTCDYKANIGIFGITAHQDTLFLLIGGTNSGTLPLMNYAIHPYFYSVDQGFTWLPQKGPSMMDEVKLPLTVVKSPGGIDYTIDQLLTPVNPTSANGSYWVETVGVKTSDGRTISLPQSHQIESLYFDSEARLYVAGSAPICGRFENFSFCGDRNGMLYVSKQAQR